MSQKVEEITPVIKTYAVPYHIRKQLKKQSKQSSGLPFRSLLSQAKRSLITPPQSPQLLDLKNPPKVIRMPDENKQLLRFCTVCASNQNRSMEAHRVLQENGFQVKSFGTGSTVRLPGPSYDKPQVYQFGTPYDEMFKELKQQNQKLYTHNGVLNMLDRNRQIKDHPEQWNKQKDIFDIVITCQERCFDSVCMDLLHRGAKLSRPVHVINVEIEDNHHEAALGAQAILEFANAVISSPDPDSEMVDILSKFQKTHQKYPTMYQLCYF
ncbi:RNA polymerase II subunit A C-terminal domain phosphatase [Starmerella bacillaris]|uniref:RNA polymerase II subunit A C-terminal domain phosphatase SSU72 n=1 Tax=Starmerella bacillaris TaxID=1247836 RepID=A0AAV5RK96_STABA|nr:RNA polymerase II subunit A C-terminal domain phosphatase [Starmerella bacillaris]